MNFKNQDINQIKLMATIGPSLDSYAKLKKAVQAGITTVRLNTSHGTTEEHGVRIDMVKKLRKELDLPITIALDTKGPEIRVHKIKNDKMTIKIGELINIYYEKEILGERGKFSVTYTKLGNSVIKGQLIMIDDGKISLDVQEIHKDKGYIVVKSLNNHYIRTKKAVNIPGADLELPFLSDIDKNFIKWGIGAGINIISASFVRDVKDVITLRNFINENGGENVKIMSKIESLKALKNINQIIMNSDSIMLARGDLGVEIPFYQVPFYEKLIIEKCRAWGKPIVIATQMLDSMIENPRPTRAEVTDVYFAGISGTDSTMLSGESAGGQFPIISIETMVQINKEAQGNFNYTDAFNSGYATTMSVNAESAYLIAKQVLSSDVKYILAFSEKGRLVSALSIFRPRARIVGLIKDKKLINDYGYYYAVYAHHQEDHSIFNNDSEIIKLAKKLGIKNGAKVVVANKSDFRVLRIS